MATAIVQRRIECPDRVRKAGAGAIAGARNQLADRLREQALEAGGEEQSGLPETRRSCHSGSPEGSSAQWSKGGSSAETATN